MREVMTHMVSDSFQFTDWDGCQTTVTATRTRTSIGGDAITLDVGGKRVLEISDLEDYGATVRAIGNLLLSIVDAPCKLPPTD